MKSKQYVLLIGILALLLSIVPVMSVAAQAEIESVCLVTDLGQVNDGTFNQFAHEGAVEATDEFGLDYNYIETQAQTDYATNIQTCLDDGYDVIVTVGFLIADVTRQAAIDNPEVYFIGVDQFVGPDADGNAAPVNYTGLQFREDQSGFLAGALAAQMTALGDLAAAEGEQEVIGGVYGIEIPPVVKFRNGYEQGAKYINPDINVLGVYLPSFIDPAAGGQAANQEIGDGADVIFGAGGPTGTGGIKEAAQQGVLVIGVDQDEYLTSFGNGDAPGAENLISSAVKRVNQAVYLAIQSLVEGGEDFPGGSIYILSAANDGVGFAPPHDADVPEEVLTKMDEILAGLKDGTIVTGVDPVSGALLPDLATAAEAAGLSGFMGALEAAGMTESMAAFPPGLGVTLFVPSDEALAAAGEMSPEDFNTVLTYHAVVGAHSAADLAALGTVTTFGGDIAVTVDDDGTVWLNETTKVVTADILFDHGVIHVIDTVLTPPAA
jgi:basic membrane lipoprotein Med (substrate-binding protein (PBP1-ABC) superfamily)